MHRHFNSPGFTLIELSVVLVIIGLLAAGILVGKDLIEAAVIRQQISQFQKFDLAVNTFRTKYNGIPGDLDADSAANFGLVARAGGQGHGDGNGIIETCPGTVVRLGCEFTLFWSDLSKSNLISDQVPLAADSYPTVNNNAESFQFFPRSKINGKLDILLTLDASNKNWYLLMGIYNMTGFGLWTGGNPTPTVSQAYGIDSKMDDGNPLSGIIIAATPNFSWPITVISPFEQGPDFCVYNNAYNLTKPDAIFCYPAVKSE